VTRKWLALLLVILGGIGLMPYLQNTLALSEGYVKGNSTEQSTYAVTAISSTNQLVVCTSQPIIVRRGSPLSGAFRCWTNYNAPIDLEWELADPANPLILSVSTPSPVTLRSTDTGLALCRSASVRARQVDQDTTGTVVFRGKSPLTTTDFYVEVNFPVTVTVKVKNQGIGWSCP